MAGRGLGSLTLDLILKMGGFEQGMDKAARVTDKRMREMEARAKKFGVVAGAAAAGAAVAISAGVKSAIDYADQLNDMNQRLGVSAEALSGWAYAAKQSGTDIDALGIGLKKLAKNMAEALDPRGQQGKLFEALGVSVVDAQGKLRDVESVLPEIASKFKELDNATQESALAMDLFGKSGTDLLEFLNNGGDGIASLRDRARELGVELDGNTLQSADKFNDTLGDISTITQGLFTQIARDLLPTLVEGAGNLRDMAEEGDLARNATTLLSTALNAGVGALDAYNAAVDYTSILFEKLARQGPAVVEMLSNIGTVGLFRDGSVAGGWKEFIKAGEDASKQWEKAVSDRELRKAGLSRKQYTDNFMSQFGAGIPGLSKATFPDLPFNFATDMAGRKPSTLAADVARAYGGNQASGGKGKGAGNRGERSLLQDMEDAKKLMEDQVRAVVSAHTEFDALAATLAGPLAEANYRYSVDLAKLNELATKGEVSTQELATAQANLRKEHEANVEAIRKQLDPLGQLIADIEFENSLMGQGSVARQMAIATRGMDADAISQQSAALGKLQDAYAQGEQLQEQVGLMDSFRESVRGLTTDIYQGENAWDSVKDAFDSFADAIFEFAQSKVLDQLFGKPGTTQSGSAGGGIAGLIQTFLGAWSGSGFSYSSGGVTGADVAGVFDDFMGGYANGGLLPAHSFAEVNERGLEMMTVKGRDYLMTGNDAVTITPNHKLGGMGGGGQVVQNFYNPRMYDRSTSAQREAEAAKKVQHAMRFA